MPLNFCGLCGSKPKLKQENAGKRNAPQPHPARCQNQSSGAQTTPVHNENALDEFIRGVEKQTSQLQARQEREMAALQWEMTRHRQLSKRIDSALARSNAYAVDDAELEKELAALENE